MASSRARAGVLRPGFALTSTGGGGQRGLRPSARSSARAAAASHFDALAALPQPGDILFDHRFCSLWNEGRTDLSMRGRGL
jgi:hypothetical protein